MFLEKVIDREMFNNFKNKKRRREEEKQIIISEIKKVHQTVHPLDPEISKILVKGIKNLEKGKNPEYVAYQIGQDLIGFSLNRFDYDNNCSYVFPEPIQELKKKCDEIGKYFIRLNYWSTL